MIGLGLGATMLFLFRSSPETGPDQKPQSANNTSGLRFRWRYIALPLIIFVLTIALVAYFYRLLPEEIAYHFGSGGTADEWTGRVAITLWTLLPQFLLTLFAAAIAWGIAKLSSTFRQMEGLGVNMDTIAIAMGNMLALPQAILFFAMLDIFSYNAYEIRILPLWAIALIIMALGAVILGIFFVRSIRQVRDSQ
ncbi:MAG TPA: DUF1648 domain-containing protein [Dehalococcoidia bacterium]|nr:DUF1648 domain-containing protein [Dehalococcoidia bacterium]